MRRLQSAQDIRRFLASLINRTEAGSMDVNLAKSLTYIASVLVRVIEGSDIEKRISELENKMEDRK